MAESLRYDVFTPRDWVTDERLTIPMEDVEVLSGKLLLRRRGIKAIIRIRGKVYQVHGAACGAPRCMCDARLKEVRA